MIGKTWQSVLPKIKFRLIRAMTVKGMEHALNRSAKAKFTKYLSFFNLREPRDVNITNRAATLPTIATKQMTKEILFVIHWTSLMFERLETDNDE